MALSMSKRERINAIVGGQAVDRPAYAFWGHHFDAEYSLPRHVASQLWWCDYLDHDLLKLQPRASYHIEPWGASLRYQASGPVVVGGGKGAEYSPASPAHSLPQRVAFPVKKADDFAKLEVLAPNEGALGERLVAIRMVKDALKTRGMDTPILETVFNPLSIAARLMGSDSIHIDAMDAMTHYIHHHGDQVHHALEVITKTFIGYVKEALSAGADGFFFATVHWASYDRLSKEDYAEFGRPYDLRVLEAMQDAWFNMLHVCQAHVMLYDLADYPVQALSWATADPGNPSLGEAWQKIADKVLVGGITKDVLSASGPEAAIQAAERACADTQGRRWIAAPDCSVSAEWPVTNMKAVAEYLRQRERV